jgi:uncharacterized damage-inducible protein DinB
MSAPPMEEGMGKSSDSEPSRGQTSVFSMQADSDRRGTFVMLALYNQRMNAGLLRSSALLSEEQLNLDTGGFFGSIIAHWNHIMFADLIMFRRIADNKLGAEHLREISTFPVSAAPTDIYYPKLDRFARRRGVLDQIILDWVRGVAASDLNGTLSFVSTEGNTVRIVVRDLLQHIFMHQIHHRGQITCLLSQRAIDYGCTDLPVIVPEGSAAHAL